MRRILFTVCLCAGAAAAADESDQFLVWDRELQDAAPAINRYVNDRIAAGLARINESNPNCDCETLTTGLLTDIYQDRLRAPLTEYIEATDTIDVYPPRAVIPAEIIDHSIYRNALITVTIRVTRNIRIGDVYLGTDKLNHVFGIGRRYYTRYLSALKAGRTPEQAEDDAIAWGIVTENTFLGTTTNGIFSLADLESNYRGLQLARSLCAGDTPYLARENGRWTPLRPIDLRDYVDPSFDESFNPPLHSGLLQGAVLRVLRQDYAPRTALLGLATRFDTYRAKLPPPSRSLLLTRQHLREKGIPSQRPELLKALGIADTHPAAPMDALGPEN